MTKRITIEVDDDTHAKLSLQAKANDRVLVKHIRRVLDKQAAKGEAADA
jgi:predicted transcriptional regulator